jgi:hypothetical protein
VRDIASARLLHCGADALGDDAALELGAAPKRLTATFRPQVTDERLSISRPLLAAPALFAIEPQRPQDQAPESFTGETPGQPCMFSAALSQLHWPAC